MDHSEIYQFIDSLIYDFDTIRYLQEYGRIKETVPMMKRIFVKIQLFQQEVIEKQDSLKGVFPKAFWEQSFLGTETMGDMRNKTFEMSSREDLILEKDLEEIGFINFVRDTRRWAYQNMFQLREIIKSPQQKKLEMVLVVLCGCVIGLCLALVLILKVFTQNWGLKGDFYDGKNFEKWVATGVNKNINFHYYLEMNSHIPHEQNYSARWKGFLVAPKDGNYTFSLLVDDGARLFIDDKPVVDAWYDSDSVEFKKSIFLTKGPHTIRLDYYNHLWGIALRLFWTPEGGKKEIIPAYYLRQSIGGL